MNGQHAGAPGDGGGAAGDGSMVQRRRQRPEVGGDRRGRGRQRGVAPLAAPRHEGRPVGRVEPPRFGRLRRGARQQGAIRIPGGRRGRRAGTDRIGTEVGLGHQCIPRPNAPLQRRRDGAGMPARF